MLRIAGKNNHGSNTYTLSRLDVYGGGVDVGPGQSYDVQIDEIGLEWLLADIAGYSGMTAIVYDGHQGSIRKTSHINVNLSGTVNDLEPTGNDDAYIYRLNPSGLLTTLTGIVGVDGKEIVLLRVDTTPTNVLTLANDTGSSAANRFLLPGLSSLSLAVGDCLRMWKDPVSSRWRPA